MGALNPLFVAVRDFLKVYLPKERKCSNHTIRAYRKSLELLFEFVKTKKKVPLHKIKFDMIDRTILSEFLDYLENERNCSVSTRNHRLNCIRAFYAYAAEEDVSAVAYLEEIKKVESAKVPEKLVSHMSETAIKAILSQPNVEKSKGLRDMFIMLLLYKTGARIQELMDIRLHDLQFGKAPKVLLRGKGGKNRYVPLRDNITSHLKEYLRVFHSDADIYSDEYLFFAVRNGTKKRMTEDNVRHFIQNYGEAARKECLEVPENVHPHLFRHSCAMNLYQNGVELTLISQWLGHSDLETTLIYAHADTEIKRKAI